MAITYKKALKTIVITTSGGATVTVADTAERALASNALAEFEAFQTIHAHTENGITLIPFHAVDNIAVTVAESEDITRPDPYGCDEKTEPAPEPTPDPNPEG